MSVFAARHRMSLRVEGVLFGWVALMFVVSSTPGNRLPEVGLWQWDKLAHVFEFAVLALLLHRYLNIRKAVAHTRAWLPGLFIGLGYAVFDELHQMLVPMRSCAWQDCAADAAGLVIGFVCARLWYCARSSR